jgi:hypothetical protein
MIARGTHNPKPTVIRTSHRENTDHNEVNFARTTEINLRRTKQLSGIVAL